MEKAHLSLRISFILLLRISIPSLSLKSTSVIVENASPLDHDYIVVSFFQAFDPKQALFSTNFWSVIS